MDRRILWTKAKEADYPMCALAASLVIFGLGRRFILNREASHEILSSRGIAAGSPFAPYELTVYLEGLIVLVRTWNEMHGKRKTGMKAVLSIHVDDVFCVHLRDRAALRRGPLAVWPGSWQNTSASLA